MKKYNLFHCFILLGLILGLASCSHKKTDNELWYDAIQNLKDGKNKEAIKIFDKIAEEYPQSKFAPKGLFEAGKLYQEKKVKGNSLEESLYNAILYYNKVSRNFPKSTEAPEAMFIVGFIEANEMDDFISASRDYNLFLSKYPNHELAAAAKAELQNMGKTPEEILNKKLAGQK